MSNTATISIGGNIDLIFSAISVKTGQPLPNAKISNHAVILTNPSIASFIQDSTNPNIFHFKGLSGGTTDINCTAVISV